MLDRLRQLFSLDAGSALAEADVIDEKLAVAALLIHISMADGELDDQEQATLYRLLGNQFDLSERELTSLVEQATEAEHESVGLYEFTSVLKQRFNHDQMDRIVLMLWQMVFADGQSHEFEENIVWRVAELLGVSSRTRMILKKQAAAAASGAGPDA